MSYEVPFPEPSSHWDPREATALPGAPGFERVWTGLGALNRLFSSVVLLGEMGIELQPETRVDGKVQYGL